MATRSEIEERPYDPRREARRQLTRVPLPDDVDPRELDQQARRQLTTLSKDTADLVARHLVMAGRLMDDDPQGALAHARAARAMGGRVGVVREANGLVAYAAGEWSEALSELRTARRITGEPDHLPVMADCERALGRPDRALIVAEDPQASSLDPAGKVEMLIVAAGARRDLGQVDAAVVSLQVGALEGAVRPWTSRLRYAYADALLEAGRTAEARAWFSRAADADPSGETDAVDRLLELDGIAMPDLDDEDEDDDTVTALPTQAAAQTLAEALSSWADRDGTGRGTPASADDAAVARAVREPSTGPLASPDPHTSDVQTAKTAADDVEQQPAGAVDMPMDDADPEGSSGPAVGSPLFQAATSDPVTHTGADEHGLAARAQVPVVMFEAGPDEPEMRLFD